MTEAELNEWLRFRKEEDPADRQLALRELILIKSLAEEVERLGLDRRPEVRLELERSSAALATAELRRRVEEAVDVSDEEVEILYQAIKDTCTQPRRVRLYNLFKRLPPEATDAEKMAVREQMERLRERLLGGEDFGELAEAESDSQSRFQKGLLGNVRAGTFPPPIDEIAMKPWEISEILSSKDGLTILYCEKILEKVYCSPENLRQIARNRLEKTAFKKAWAELQSEMLASAAPVYRWQVLNASPRDPDATLVELTAGERLTVADADRLVQTGRVPVEPSRVPRERLQHQIEKYLVGRRMTREIDRRGLGEHDDLGTRRLWARRQVLASHARVHLVEKELESPAEEEIRQILRGPPRQVRPSGVL